MRFGDILDQWEQEQKRQQKQQKKQKQTSREGRTSDRGENDFSRLIDRYFEQDTEWERFIKEKEETAPEAPPGAQRSILRRMTPEDSIDLHGMTRDEAWNALDAFIYQSRRRSLRKVLIIHGKGNHSGDRAVLPELVSAYLRQSPYTGESGKANRGNGGSGATWVVIV